MRSLTCKELIEFLWAYLDGEVTPEERGSFEDHLAGCPTCVRYLNTYRQTRRLAREALLEEEVPPEVPTELAAAVLASRRTGAREGT